MSTILFVWVVVSGHVSVSKWEKLDVFPDMYYCETAGRQLGLKPEFFRCVPTGKK